MDNPEELRLVKLLEDHTARLSPEGKELWERMERLKETSRSRDDLEVLRDAQAEVLRETRNLPREEQIITTVLSTLALGLRASSLAEDGWGLEVADKFRRGIVIKAAHQKARLEYRDAPPVEEISLDEALALLATPYASDGETK